MSSSPFIKVFHWGPLTALGIVKTITWVTLHYLGMWWPPWTTVGSSINAAVFLSLSGATLFYFISALSLGPGFVPLNWRPINEDDTVHLQYCSTCNGYKAPRAHHCRQCGRCVKKMDHHCPWINGCVGWANHTHFTLFLIFAVLGSFHGGVIICCSLYNAFQQPYYTPFGYKFPAVRLTLLSLVASVLALGFAIGVVLAVGMLLYFQIRNIRYNRTGVEEWIIEKAVYRNPDFLFPYDLGSWKLNFQWMDGLPDEQGIYWKVLSNCNQYTLTIEQLAQKAAKRERLKMYLVKYSYTGTYLPIFSWPSAAIRPPTAPCVESRLKLIPGDTVGVTRWRRHWLFGVKTADGDRGPRGWFPRKSVEEIYVELEDLKKKL